MSKEVKDKKKMVEKNTYESLKGLYYSGKVKPTLNKIVAELKNDPENLQLTLLACQCLERTKNFDDLATYADVCIKLDAEIADGYYYKGVALQHTKGKEQAALKNFSKAIALDPENTLYLKSKAVTHLLLYKDYDLPITFAEKHRVKAEENLLKIVELVEEKEGPDYIEFFTLGEVNMMMTQSINAKKYYIKAVNAYDVTDELQQDKNIYKDLIKAQKACVKLIDKFTE
jgi:tetratricopeptide (TPR) repeat protein